jgi:hypothetical protein
MVITLMLFISTAFGEQNKKEEAFWGPLQGKVQKLTSSKKNTSSATVAGVKGAKNYPADIYWKGREKKVEVSEEEIHKFSIAMEYQSNGEKEMSLKHFEAFLKEYPSSPLYTDGTEAVRLIKAELSAQPPATPAEPQATATAPKASSAPVPVSATTPASSAPAAR